ncbi:MAG: serine hydrolase domain-containing protein [Candidatus Hodarchaeota archaeon]
MEEVNVNGYCDDRFIKVKEGFTESFKQGLDIGASVCMYLEGKPIVDLWGGYMDAEKTRPWKEDTIVCVASSTKVMTVLCIHMLIDRGLIDVEEPVATYWPEFAQAGKENIPVKYVLSHTSGLPGFGRKMHAEDFYDWEKCIKALEVQKPWWEPGTKSGYHGLTHGYLLGELVRRITGKTVGTFFREEVAEPLNVDFYIGLPEEYDDRVADPIEQKQSLMAKLMGKLFLSKFMYYILGKPISIRIAREMVSPKPDTPKTRAFRGAEIPAGNGHGNAKGMAKVAGALANGGELDGVRLISPETIEKSIVEQNYYKDLVLGRLVRLGLGWGLNSDELRVGPNERVFFWGGYGGSGIAVDLDAKLGMAFAMNKLQGALSFGRLQKLMIPLYEVLEK